MHKYYDEIIMKNPKFIAIASIYLCNHKKCGTTM